MKRLINIAVFIFLSQICTGQVMLMFSSDSLASITSPLDVDSLFYWFAADVGVTDSLGGTIATDEGVGTWNDLSGNGYHVTQSTDGARPVYKATGGPGGYPCIQFDGTNDFLASAAHWWGSDDITIFVVMKFANATRDANEIIAAKYNGASNLRQWAAQAVNTSASYVHRLVTSSAGTSADGLSASNSAKSASYRTLVWTSTGAALPTFHADGTAATVTGSAATIFDDDEPLTIGTIDTTAGPLQGSISEIIVFSRALSATERTAIENYLNIKYDLY